MGAETEGGAETEDVTVAETLISSSSPAAAAAASNISLLSSDIPELASAW